MTSEADAIFRRFASKAKFRHIQLLIHLHELGSMKRAADVLGVSQPAISLMLSELERLLGVQLFLRHARGVSSTPVTRDLLPVARRIVSALGDGSEVVANVLQDSAGFVRIAATPAGVGGVLHPVIPTLVRKFPKVHVEMSEIAAANPLEVISDGACDILCLRQPEITPETWVFEHCAADALVVICGARHPLAPSGRASRDQLAAHRWLLTRRGSVAREAFEDMSRRIGLPPRLQTGIVTHVPAITLELLATEPFLTLIPRSVALPWIRDGSAVELHSDATTQLPPLGFLWQRNDANRVTRHVAQAILAIFARPPA